MSGKIEQFEDLIAWQKARELARAIYEVTQQGAIARDFGLSGQLQRAAVSIMSNIAEGFERGNPREFHQFISISKSSCAELRSQLYASLDAGYIDSRVFDELMVLAKETAKIVGDLRASVERKRDGK